MHNNLNELTQKKILFKELEELSSCSSEINNFYKKIDKEAILNIYNLALIVISPDSFIQNKVRDVINFWEKKGLFVILSRFIDINERQIEDLYRFNLNDGKISWWLSRKLYSMGVSLSTIWAKEDILSQPLCSYISELKGDASPWNCKENTLRKILNASNRVVNLMHASDNLADFIRESLIFFPSYKLIEAINKLSLKKITNKDISFKSTEFNTLINMSSFNQNYTNFTCILMKLILRIIDVIRNNIPDYKSNSDFENTLDLISNYAIEAVEAAIIKQNVFDINYILENHFHIKKVVKLINNLNNIINKNNKYSNNGISSLLRILFNICSKSSWNVDNIESSISMLKQYGIRITSFEEYILISSIAFWGN